MSPVRSVVRARTDAKSVYARVIVADGAELDSVPVGDNPPRLGSAGNVRVGTEAVKVRLEHAGAIVADGAEVPPQPKKRQQAVCPQAQRNMTL